MKSTDRPLVFRTWPTIVTALATVLTIVVSLVQLGAWVNENAVWILWVAIALFSLGTLLLTARLAAVSEQRDRATSRLTNADKLSGADQALADELYEYASDTSTLSCLGEFFPYQIPMGVVHRLEVLEKLPVTRSAHDTELAEHFQTITDAAHTWRLKLIPLVSSDGDHYTTRLQYQVSEKEYQRHSALTDELTDVGFDLHEKLLKYQRYYASL